MQELSGWLVRVEAPAELWERVRGSQAEACATGQPKWHRLQPVAFVLSAAVLAAVFFFPRALHSSDPSQIRAWVRSKAGIDVPLPAKLAPSVRLVSARMKDRTTAQVDYQVNGREALLLVSLASAAVAGDGRHRILSRGSNRSSWTMRGLVYTVLCPSGEVSQVACQLCHSL
jgi:hypothetical protein